MAIYHLSIKIISRGKGKSAVSAAAYRSGSVIKNEYDGMIHDYTRKKGVVHTKILLPDHAPREYSDRSILWNSVEKKEKSKNSQLAREIELALPIELSFEQNKELVIEYVKNNFVDNGMCADICIHDKADGNPHAHIMLTMRPINQDGTWGDKQRKEYILDDNGNKIYDKKKRQYKCTSIQTTDWNDREKSELWRSKWAEQVNSHLSMNGINEHIDHRSYERQGLERIPTIHMGVAACQMEQKGIVTERGNINREAISRNNEMRQTKARIRKLKNWLYSQPLTDAPTLNDMMSGVFKGNELSNHWNRIKNLKLAASVFNFIKENELTSVEQLAEKVKKIHSEHYNLAKTIKEKERRIGTLTEHLRQYGIYKEHRSTYLKYKKLEPKKAESYLVKHPKEIRLYENAREYFDKVMNGRTTLPIKEWEREYNELNEQRIEQNERYSKIKDEIKSVEALRRSADNLMKEIKPEIQTIRKNERER